MVTKTIPAVVEVYCDVCGVKCGGSRHATVVSVERYEYCYMGNRQGKCEKTFDLCDACGEKVAEFLTPKTK